MTRRGYTWMILGTNEMKERLREVMNKVWKGCGFAKECREGVICPIHKKGNQKNINYRGIRLLNAAYKIPKYINDCGGKAEERN